MSIRVAAEGKARRVLAVALAGTLASGAFAVGDASAETLQEAVEAALGYHPQVWRDQALSAAAEQLVEEAYSDFLPDLDLDGSSGYEATNSPTTRGSGRGTVGLVRSEASARLTQLIFDFYGTSNRVASAESDLEASKANLQATAESVARSASRYYLDALNARERVVLAEQNLSDLTGLHDRIRGRAEAGRASEADLAQAVSRVALAKANLASRRGDEREAMSRFVENVGHVPGALERPAAPDYPQAGDLDAALAVAMQRNPVAHSTAAQWDARKYDVEVERSAYFPRLDFEASSSVGENIDGIRGTQEDLQFLVRLTWDLFDGLGNVARTRRASFEASAASQSDSEARRSIRESVRVAFRSLQTAESRLPQLRADAEASTRTYQAYLQQYEVGQRSLLNLLDARQEMWQAQEGEVQGIYDVLQAHYELLFSMGLLLDKLAVVVFQDRDQYHEHRLRYGKMAAAAGDAEAAAAHNDAMTFSEADWSGEVAVPGGLEFGTWLGDDGLRETPGEAPIGAEAVALAAPIDPAKRKAAASKIRRDIEGIEVEIVPAMNALPEANISVLPAGAPAGSMTDALANDAPEGAAEGMADDAEAGPVVADSPAADGSAVDGSAVDGPAVHGDASTAAIPAEDAASRAVEPEGTGPGWDDEASADLVGFMLEKLAALPAERHERYGQAKR